MGRDATEPIQPGSIRRTERARFAKETIHKTVPALLHSIPRARRGIETAHLLVDLPRVNPGGSSNNPKRKPKGKRGEDKDEHDPSSADAPPPGIRIRIVDADTLAAVSLFTPSAGKSAPAKTAVLCMASPLRPGGGVFTGAQSQEESLCVRTTLYWSLREDYYRLPPLGCVYTPDVLVFRDEENKDLAKKERFYVDVISCAALRFPETEGGRYENVADREQMWEKMRLVMRAAARGGVGNVVLGAWGCGAYGNPVEEVAEGWKKVLVGAGKGGRGKVEVWEGIEEVVFAISTKTVEGKQQLEGFQKVFEGVAYEDKEPEAQEREAVEAEKDEDDPEEIRLRDIQELTEQIQIKEAQLDRIKNESLRERIAELVTSLKKELVIKSNPQGHSADEDSPEVEEGEGSASKT
ncbi:uncharacterized protein H6S33_002453 [Morchella sextelata]|uniref:uncharacterized protein n=1 Tax=Morchella sextelata TaxID=1174677 RepID=UPI001D03E7DC|nr:uncharacterized protein H6S33_002453 [Morchella sextelata]KAH0607419.1 hypothetical protein H6S33_002453 [Morchella sextelata]